jgi:hypothetical protein
MKFDDSESVMGKILVVPPEGGYAGVKPPKGGTTSNGCS